MLIVAENLETKRQLNVQTNKTRTLERTTGNLTRKMTGVESRLSHLEHQTGHIENATENINRQIEYLHNSTSELVSGECTSCNLVSTGQYDHF